MKKRKHLYVSVLLILLILTVLLNLAACLPAFCDWYGDHVYGLLADGISRLTAPVPAAVGEIVMYIAAALALFAVIFLILLLFLRKKQGYRKFCGGYFKTLAMILVCGLFIYTVNWMIPFRGTVLGKGDTGKRTVFTYQEIRALTEYAANGANAAAEEIAVAEDGTVQFPTVAESEPKIAAAMQALAAEYPRLNGYYPPVKNALCSDILDRMHIGGYNYIYTMEPTRNKYLSPTYQPVLDAHELSHHKGYYKENEANFLSQLALAQSDDPYLRFSGFYDMYNYCFADFSEAYGLAAEDVDVSDLPPMPKLHKGMTEEEKDVLRQHLQRYEEVLGAQPELTPHAYAIIEQGRVIEQDIYQADAHPIDEMPAVQTVIEETAEIGWKTHGEVLQENSYDGVTLLLLQYFDGKLF